MIRETHSVPGALQTETAITFMLQTTMADTITQQNKADTTNDSACSSIYFAGAKCFGVIWFRTCFPDDNEDGSGCYGSRAQQDHSRTYNLAWPMCAVMGTVGERIIRTDAVLLIGAEISGVMREYQRLPTDYAMVTQQHDRQQQAQILHATKATKE